MGFLSSEEVDSLRQVMHDNVGAAVSLTWKLGNIVSQSSGFVDRVENGKVFLNLDDDGNGKYVNLTQFPNAEDTAIILQDK